MARYTAILLATSFLLASLGAPNASGDPLGDAFQKELKALSGTWRPIFAENNGYRSSENHLKGISWIRSADGRWGMRRDGKAVLEWAVRAIDVTKKPKTIDLEVTTGEHKGVVYQGIYELDGDTLRICLAMPDRAERPTEFSASKGSLSVLSVFKRETSVLKPRNHREEHLGYLRKDSASQGTAQGEASGVGAQHHASDLGSMPPTLGDEAPVLRRQAEWHLLQQGFSTAR